ncbi:outer membrane beta-barrel protein [Fontimonas sp. SYSU GA230001]|uniref:outer membrane beta-barrel protein n=1 Tax=Fontimonas sp. SYSU GA230001 TaxID=3142450 RepID=UPI0032B4712D
MKKLGVLAFGLMASTAVFAQEEAVPEAETDSGYTEMATDPADVPESQDEGAAADADGGAGDEAAAETEASSDTSGTEESYASGDDTGDQASDEAGDEAGSGEEPGEGHKFYVGGDYVWTHVSFSKPALGAAFGGEELDSKMYRVRAGMRVFEAVGLEVQAGFDGGSSDKPNDGEYSTQQFYGVYLVPTGVLFDLVEVGGAIGYASTKLERGSASETLSGASFGVNLDIPLFTSDALELRVGGGGTVFRAQNSARISGYHAGVRIDFRL